MHDQERCILRDIADSLLEVEAGILWCALIGVQLNCTFRRVSRTAATRLLELELELARELEI